MCGAAEGGFGDRRGPPRGFGHPIVSPACIQLLMIRPASQTGFNIICGMQDDTRGPFPDRRQPILAARLAQNFFFAASQWCYLQNALLEDITNLWTPYFAARRRDSQSCFATPFTHLSYQGRPWRLGRAAAEGARPPMGRPITRRTTRTGLVAQRARYIMFIMCICIPGHTPLPAP